MRYNSLQMRFLHFGTKCFGSWHHILKILKPKLKAWSTACVNYPWIVYGSIWVLQTQLSNMIKKTCLRLRAVSVTLMIILFSSSLSALGSNRPNAWISKPDNRKGRGLNGSSIPWMHWILLASTEFSSEVWELDSKLESLECESITHGFILPAVWCFRNINALCTLGFMTSRGILSKEGMRPFVISHRNTCISLLLPPSPFPGETFAYTWSCIFLKMSWNKCLF